MASYIDDLVRVVLAVAGIVGLIYRPYFQNTKDSLWGTTMGMQFPIISFLLDI